MLALTLHHLFPLLILPIVITIVAPKPPPYTPTDSILLNCGASSDDALEDGRHWVGDTQSKRFCPFNSQKSSPFEASQQRPLIVRVPYMTARIINSILTCTFPLLPGPKFIRLYFYPDTYSVFNTSSSFFTVTANNYTLLNNFSAYLTVSANPYIVKEFIVTLKENQELKVTFDPSPSSFAFINGIEVISMPNNLYTRDTEHPYTFVDFYSNTLFTFDNTTSLETVHRLNVGGNSILDDTGMFRTWLDDSTYILGQSFGVVHEFRNDVTIKYTKDTPAYTAPAVVYISKRTMGRQPQVNLNYNLTWIFHVDSGFNYLVRLHFCETEEMITDINQRVFFIFINNMTAEAEADVFAWSGGRDIPVYKDYVVSVPGNGSNQELLLALHPNMKSDPVYTDAILNGLQIFKLNQSDGNLGGPNPAPPELHQIIEEKKKKKRKESSLVVATVGAVIGFVLAFSLILLFVFYRRKANEKDTGNSRNKSTLPTALCHQFTLAEMRACTRNFDDQNLIGRGGFGTVYKGYIESGTIPVAIKRLESSSNQGILEFRTEIAMLSRLRHAHLVSLIGYCDEQGEMMLVYEFVPRGNLQDHLYKTKNPPIPWKQRLEICIGAARGLDYLHTGSKHTIIHRDVKASNILLDENWVAKVSDFGLSKTGPTSESQTHVSTVVKGSFGYLDPEYYRRHQLTEKSDVYSFGVVLLEVLSARKPVISTLPKEEVNLVEWTRNCNRTGALDRMIDQQLKGDIAPVSLNKFVEIAESCVNDKANERPTMDEVVWSLEFALQLQESAEKNVVVCESLKSSSVQCREVIGIDDEDDIFTFSGGPIPNSPSTVSTSENNSYPDRVRSGNVFSEIMDPQGR